MYCMGDLSSPYTGVAAWPERHRGGEGILYFEPFVGVAHETVSRSDATRPAKVVLKRRAAGRQRNLLYDACDIAHPT